MVIGELKKQSRGSSLGVEKRGLKPGPLPGGRYEFSAQTVRKVWMANYGKVRFAHNSEVLVVAPFDLAPLLGDG